MEPLERPQPWLAAWSLQPDLQHWPELGPGPLDLQLTEPGLTTLIGPEPELVNTYLKALAGEWPLTGGSLTLFDRAVSDYSYDAWQELCTWRAYVLKGAPLMSVLNGLRNVQVPALYHGLLSPAQASTEALELLNDLGFAGNLELLPAYLSPLQCTQIALARALLLKPSVLLAEEPWYDLDVADYGVLEAALSQCARRQAVVVTTGNLGFVREQAQQILFIGRQQNLLFHSWADLTASSDPAVQQFLVRQRRVAGLANSMAENSGER